MADDRPLVNDDRATMPDDDLVKMSTSPTPAVAGADDEVAAALVERFEGAVFHRSHGQPVVYVDRAQLGRGRGSSCATSSSSRCAST